MKTLLVAAPVVIATSFAIYLSLVDLREMRIPNRALAIGFGATAFVMFAASLPLEDLGRFLLALLGGFLSVLTFFLIHLVRPSGLGMGDVKFAGLIGMTLSWISFPVGLIGLALAFMASALFSVMILVTRMRLGSVIPFAPFMSIGLFLVSLALLR